MSPNVSALRGPKTDKQEPIGWQAGANLSEAVMKLSITAISVGLGIVCATTIAEWRRINSVKRTLDAHSYAWAIMAEPMRQKFRNRNLTAVR